MLEIVKYDIFHIPDEAMLLALQNLVSSLQKFLFWEKIESRSTSTL